MKTNTGETTKQAQKDAKHSRSFAKSPRRGARNISEERPKLGTGKIKPSGNILVASQSKARPDVEPGKGLTLNIVEVPGLRRLEVECPSRHVLNVLVSPTLHRRMTRRAIREGIDNTAAWIVAKMQEAARR